MMILACTMSAVAFAGFRDFDAIATGPRGETTQLSEMTQLRRGEHGHDRLSGVPRPQTQCTGGENLIDCGPGYEALGISCCEAGLCFESLGMGQCNCAQDS